MTREQLDREIKDTARKDQLESVQVSVSMPRSLYLFTLNVLRDGDYPTIASYIQDLIRKDKHVGNHPIEPT